MVQKLSFLFLLCILCTGCVGYQSLGQKIGNYKALIASQKSIKDARKALADQKNTIAIITFDPISSNSNYFVGSDLYELVVESDLTVAETETCTTMYTKEIYTKPTSIRCSDLIEIVSTIENLRLSIEELELSTLDIFKLSIANSQFIMAHETAFNAIDKRTSEVQRSVSQTTAEQRRINASIRSQLNRISSILSSINATLNRL